MCENFSDRVCSKSEQGSDGTSMSKEKISEFRAEAEVVIAKFGMFPSRAHCTLWHGPEVELGLVLLQALTQTASGSRLYISLPLLCRG